MTSSLGRDRWPRSIGRLVKPDGVKPASTAPSRWTRRRDRRSSYSAWDGTARCTFAKAAHLGPWRRRRRPRRSVGLPAGADSVVPGEVEHALDGEHRALAMRGRCGSRLLRLAGPARGCQGVHGHPGAMAAALAGGALAGGGGRDRACPGPVGASSRRCPSSVATMNSALSISATAWISAVVEPTTSAWSTTSSGDSGCTSTAAWGCRRRRRSRATDLNSSCTTQDAVPHQHVAPVTSGCSGRGACPVPTGSSRPWP